MKTTLTGRPTPLHRVASLAKLIHIDPWEMSLVCSRVEGWIVPTLLWVLTGSVALH
jgi:hypothetical protein